MVLNSLIKTFMVLMAALFFTTQSFAQAHAASNGGDDHSHDGIACEVVLIAAEQVVLTPPPPTPKPFTPPQRENTRTFEVNSLLRTFDCRAPPLRGPPL